MQKNKYPLVTIAIPTHNRATLLQQILHSALAQDYPNLEVIVSDNASNDNTAEICNALCKRYSNLTYFRHRFNRGGFVNFNTLLEMAKGDYIMVIGDDDWIDQNYISECMKVLSANPDAAIVAGQVKYYGINDRYLYTGIIMNLVSDCKKQRVRDYFLNVKHNGIFHGVVSKELMVRCGLKNIIGSDLLLVASFLFNGKGYTVETSSLHKRRGGISSDGKRLAKSISSSWMDYYFPRISVAKNVFEHILSDTEFASLSLSDRFLLAVQCVFYALMRKTLSVLFKKRFIEQSGAGGQKA